MDEKMIRQLKSAARYEAIAVRAEVQRALGREPELLISLPYLAQHAANEKLLDERVRIYPAWLNGNYVCPVCAVREGKDRNLRASGTHTEKSSAVLMCTICGYQLVSS